MVTAAAIASLLFNGSNASKLWPLSEAKVHIVEKPGIGKLTFTYQTFVNSEFKIPRAFIKGKFEIQDERAKEWNEQNMDVLRVCMHFGTKYDY